MAVKYKIKPNDPIGFGISPDGEFVSYRDYEILLETFIGLQDKYHSLINKLHSLAEEGCK